MFKDNDVRMKEYRYSIKTKTIKTTDYHDFNFSPSGDYYFRQKDKIFQIFDSKTNQPVDIELPKNLGEPTKWAFNHGDYLLFEKKDVTTEYEGPPIGEWGLRRIKRRIVNSVQYSIFDVKKRAIVKQIISDGEAYHWKGSKYSIVVGKEGKLSVKNSLAD